MPDLSSPRSNPEWTGANYHGPTTGKLLMLPLGLALLLLTTVGRVQGQDFQPLFDGRTLQGWHGNNPHHTARASDADRAKTIDSQQEAFRAHWSVEDEQLVNDGQGPYATTDAEYGDIELVLDYKTVAEADSGIYLRGTPQIQIWDTTEEGGKWDRNANFGSGGLFNNTRGAAGQLPLRLADRPFGEWNHFRIVQIGSRTWVELNNLLVVDGAIMENFWDPDRKLPLPATGPIHLQTHGGEIRWKNLAVRSIGTEEAISRLRGDDQKFGFQSIFNGKDLSGWQGAVDDYQVIDGAIVCKPNRGGVLFTDREYENFIVRMEFKLPPGGNNGLAIRYPGQGRASYDGMCELQVLDNEADKYSRLDPRQYHGSVYGIAAAHRGYLRPAEEWNYQEVTVEGHRIRVELNGTVILDEDVSQIDEYKDHLPHPGKMLRSGFFGFAGHNDPVAFRNIAIRELPASSEPTGDPPGLVFWSSFDESGDANLASGDRSPKVAPSTRRETAESKLPAHVRVEPDAGVSGAGLRFSDIAEDVLFYEGEHAHYRSSDWDGTVSLWMRLDPNRDLKPGFCDPIQITQRAWNNASLFIDFDQDLPRDFRLGVFPDYQQWNPENVPWDDIPIDQRPMVVVKDAPFSADHWTHVCFTWQGINDSEGKDATAKLYINGELQGSLTGPMKFSWEPDKVGTMLGLNYIGDMDELRIYNRCLTLSEVQSLMKLHTTAND